MYFSSHYKGRIVNYEQKVFIRFTTVFYHSYLLLIYNRNNLTKVLKLKLKYFIS